jgi:hypothetical protein
MILDSIKIASSFLKEYVKKAQIEISDLRVHAAEILKIFHIKKSPDCYIETIGQIDCGSPKIRSLRNNLICSLSKISKV